MILLTGGTGILGMRMVYDLLSQGKEVCLLVRDSSDLGVLDEVLLFYHGADVSELKSRLTFTEGDILDIGSLENALSSCAQVIHAAAVVSFHPKEAALMYETNRQGTANVVDACVEYGKRLLYISSVAALGRTEGKRLIDEKSTWKEGPLNSNYAISKYNAELEVWRGIEEGLEAVMVNPSIIIGAGSSKRSSGTLFGSVLQGNRFYSDGMATAVDARDVSRLALQLLESEITAQRYILHSEQIGYKEMFQTMAQAMGKRAPDIRARPWMLNFAWRVASLLDRLLGTKSRLTKETARSVSNDFDYDTSKIQGVFGNAFIPVRDAIAYHAEFYSD